MSLTQLFIIDLIIGRRLGTKAGIWDRLMDAICDYYNHNLVMVDGISIRVHHSAATVKKQ